MRGSGVEGGAPASGDEVVRASLSVCPSHPSAPVALKALGPDRVVDALVAATQSREESFKVWAADPMGNSSGEGKKG